MRKFEVSFKAKKIKKYTEKAKGLPLVILSIDDKELKNEIASDFEGVEFEFIYSSKITKNELASILEEKNSLFVVTDIKRIQRAMNTIDCYLYKKNSSDNFGTLISFDSNFDKEIIKERHLINAELIEGENNIFDLLKKAKLSHKKIVTINSNKVDVAYKVAGTWRVKTNDEILIQYFAKKQLKFSDESDFSKPSYLKNHWKPYKKIIVNRSEIEINNEYYESELFKNKINWIISEEFYTDLNVINDMLSFRYGVQWVNLAENNKLDEIFTELRKESKIEGIPYESIVEYSEHFELKVKFGRIYIYKKNNDNDKGIKIAYNFSTGYEETELITFKNSIVTNIKNHINNLTNKPKFSKKNLVRTIIGFTLLVTLSFITFNFIFDSDNIRDAFLISFSKESLMMPWIYLIIISFLISFFLPLLIGMFIEKFVAKRKIKFKVLIMYFESSIIRRAFMLLTGNYFLSLFVWGWYINRRIKVRTSSLVGTIGSVSIIRGVLYSFIGSILMLLGTFSFFIKYDAVFSLSIITIFTISWMGFLWATFTHFWVFIIILSPKFHSFIDWFIIKFKFRKKRITQEYLEKSYSNIYSIQKSNLTKGIWDNRVFVSRTLIFILAPIIIEGIETVLYFDMIDGVVLKQSGNFEEFKLYFDWISISGIRLVANNVHNFPILNMIPGQGMGVSELVLNNLYETIYISKHAGENLDVIWGGYNSNQMAQMTTLVTRFFNVYLVTILTFTITMIIIIMEILRRKVANDEK